MIACILLAVGSFVTGAVLATIFAYVVGYRHGIRDTELYPKFRPASMIPKEEFKRYYVDRNGKRIVEMTKDAEDR